MAPVRQRERVQDAAVRSEAMRHAMPLEPYTAQDYAADEHAALEARARRAARRVGLYATKTRWRVGSIDNFGKFQLINPHTNMIVAGQRFDLGPQAIIDFCEKIGMAEA